VSDKKRRVNLGLDRFSGFYIWAVFIVIFGIWTPNLFLTADNAHSVASGQAVLGILAIAVLVPLAAGAYDLSVGAVINLSTVLVVVLQTQFGWAMWLAIPMGILAGVAVGFINGLIVVKLRVSSFIATLGMATIVTAFQTITSGDTQPLPPTQPAWSALTQTNVFGFQIVFVYLLVIAVIFWWLLDHTPVGRYIYATGGNIEAARLSGVRVGKWTWISLIISGGLSGLAGVFYASLSGPALGFGPALLLPAFAAVFLGSTQIKPGRFNIWGTILAVYVLATGVRGLQYITGVRWLNDMFNGLALIVAVAFAVSRQRHAQNERRLGTRAAAVVEPPSAPTAHEPQSTANDPVN
jgi:ribose transport system permease protein